jgi:hypothetical protein
MGGKTRPKAAENFVRAEAEISKARTTDCVSERFVHAFKQEVERLKSYVAIMDRAINPPAQ